MKRYALVHKQSGLELVQDTDLRKVNEVKKSLGPDFSTITWVGFAGLPSACCVMRDDNQLETICLYRAEAEKICAFKNASDTDPHSYTVVQVIINTAYPHAHGEYSV